MEATVTDKYSTTHFVSAGKSLIPIYSYYFDVDARNNITSTIQVPVAAYSSISESDTVFIDLALNKDGEVVSTSLKEN